MGEYGVFSACARPVKNLVWKVPPEYMEISGKWNEIKVVPHLYQTFIDFNKKYCIKVKKVLIFISQLETKVIPFG